MFGLSILCVISFIAVALGYGIRYEDFRVDLFSEGSESFERQIKRSLTTTKNFFARDDVRLIATGAGKILNYVPFVTTFSEAIPALQNTLAKESDFKKELEKAIPDATQRAIANNNLRTMQAALRTVSQNIRSLEAEDDFTSASKTAMIHNIHDALDTIVNTFSDRESIFRKYPLIATNILFALTSTIAVFVPLETALVPVLAKRSRISCNFEEVLDEYQQLAAESRISKTQITSVNGDIDNNNFVRDVMGRRFNEYGYNKSNSGQIDCERGCNDDHICLKDLVTGNEFDAGVGSSIYGCVLVWMELIRHRIEEAFEDPIELTKTTCRDEIRNRPRLEPTGFGWWEIIFHSGWAQYSDDYKKCDNTGDCDAYIKLFIDGTEVFTSDTKWDKFNPYWGETYKSSRISKDVSITIEMWDNDSGFLGSNDDLMMRWQTNIDDFLKNGEKWVVFEVNSVGSHFYNKIITSSIWKDEYPDD